MRKKNTCKFIFGFAFLVLANISNGQKLQLDDILTAYRLDSAALKAFCREKQFDWLVIEENNWMVSHIFQSATDRKIKFIRTFPKDQSDKIFLYYYYDDKKEYKGFKDSLKVKGFAKRGSHEMLPDVQNYTDQRERYVTDKLELELSTSNFAGRRSRTLLLYKRINS
jgi:hypothetical protein